MIIIMPVEFADKPVVRTNERKPIHIRPVLEAQIWGTDLSHPGFFIYSLGMDKEYPTAKVIMPNGDMIVEAGGVELRGQFDDGVAQAYARQNNGIFFPAHPTEVLFADVLEATRRLAVNLRAGGRDHRLNPEDFQQGTPAYEALKKEGAFLKFVRAYQTGLRGDIVGEKGPRTWGEGADWRGKYGIKLDLNMCGFGDYHWNVSGRRVTARLNLPSKGLSAGSSTAIREVLEQVPKGNYRLEWEERKKGEDDGLLVHCFSPGIWTYESNERMEHPVAGTQELLDVLTPYATRIANGLVKMEKDAEVRAKARHAKTRKYFA